MYDKLPDQARKVVVWDDSSPCVSEEIFQLIFEPHGDHVGCIVERFNQHFSKIELTLVMGGNALERSVRSREQSPLLYECLFLRRKQHVSAKFIEKEKTENACNGWFFPLDCEQIRQWGL